MTDDDLTPLFVAIPMDRPDPDRPIGTILICEPRPDCADANINRWYCMRGHDGAAPGVCPLAYCDSKGANR